MKKTNKLFTKIGTAIVGIAMAIGVGVAASRDGAREAKAAAGDEITAVANIESGKSYYIKGVRTNGTVEYLTFNDSVGDSVAGTSANSTSGAHAITFVYESSNWYLKTPGDHYLLPGTSNAKLIITDTKTAVTLADAKQNTADGAADGFISISNNGNYIQKNKTGVNFGRYTNTQNNITLIEAGSFGTLDHIKVATNPTKTSFDVGETFNSSGLVLTGYDADDENNAHTQSYSSDFTTNYDGYTFVQGDIGQQTVTVTYSGKTTTYTINVGVAPDFVHTEASNSIFNDESADTSNTKTHTPISGAEYINLGGYNDTSRHAMTLKNVSGMYFGNNSEFVVSSNKKYISKIVMTTTSDCSEKMVMTEGPTALSEATTVVPALSNSNKTLTYTFSGTNAFFKLKSTAAWYINIDVLKIYLGDTVENSVASSVEIATPASVYVGKTLQLSATVHYTNKEDDSRVTWSVTSGNGATVNDSGLVTAVAATATTITATSVDKNSSDQYVSASVVITPLANPIVDVAWDTTGAKKVYYVGDELVTTGVVATGTNAAGDDDINVPLTASNFSGFDSSSPVANQTITVTYETWSTQYTIKVLEMPGVHIIGTDFTGSYSDADLTKNGIKYGVSQIMKGSGNVVQMKASVGHIYNKDALNSRITKIEIEYKSVSKVNLYLEKTAVSNIEGLTAIELAASKDNFTTETIIPSEDVQFFRIATGSNAAYFERIDIWHTTSVRSVSLSPSSLSFDELEEGNAQTTISIENFFEEKVTFEALSRDQEKLPNSAISINGNVISIAKTSATVGETVEIDVNAKVGGVVKATTVLTVSRTSHDRQFLNYELTTPSTDLVFDAGDVFSITGLVVTGTFDAAPTTQDITNLCTFKLLSDQGDLTEATPGTTKLSGGNYKVKIIYGDKNTLEYSIKVLTLTSIAILTKPTKTTYRIGQTIDLAGMVLEGTKSDGSKVTITEGFTSSTLDSSTAGEKTVTITYKELTAKLTVTVVGDIYYSKISNASDLKAGDKVLIVVPLKDNNAAKLAAGETTGSNKYLEAKDITLTSDGKILQTDEIQACEFTLSGQADAWKLTNDQGKELAVTGTASANIALVDPASELAHTWSISYNADNGTFTLTAPQGGSLQYNSGSPRFTNYTTKQVAPQLYKVDAAAPVAPTVSKIEIESMPTKTQYNVGDEFNQAGLSVKATYSDGSTKVISTGLTVTGFDSTSAGEKTLTVTYEGKTATFKVTVSDSTQPTTKTLAEINVINTQDTYEYGQEIDKTKLTVTAVYSDGTSAAVTNYTLSGYNKNQSGQQTVTVSYSEDGVTKTATFTVTVGAQPADAVEAARQAALRELQAFVANLGESNYSAENWAKIQGYLQEAPEILAGLDTVERIEKYVTTFKNAMTVIPTIAEQEAAALADAKVAALEALEQYYNSFDKNNYDETGVASLTRAYNDGRDAIEAATTIDAIDAALRNAKAAMDAVSTKPAAPARRCGGDIAATSIILSAIALAGVGLLVFKKRKED